MYSWKTGLLKMEDEKKGRKNTILEKNYAKLFHQTT